MDTNNLTFAQFRAANTARLPQFKNGRGEPAHSEPDGANILKKIKRGDLNDLRR